MTFETNPSHPARAGGDERGDELDEIPERDEIDRGDTALRMLFTLLLFVIARLVGALLAVLVVFELGFTLITRREPSESVRRFGNQVLSYLVRIGRYVTYNDREAPFPFHEFREELDLTVPRRPAP